MTKPEPAAWLVVLQRPDKTTFKIADVLKPSYVVGQRPIPDMDVVVIAIVQCRCTERSRQTSDRTRRASPQSSDSVRNRNPYPHEASHV